MEVPDGITLTVDGLLVKVKGPKGESEKRFSAKGVSIKLQGKKVTVEGGDAAVRGSIEAHMRNLIKGVQQGYTRKLKMIYAHFPFTLEVKGDKLNIKNILGERLPRTAKIIGKTKIESKGQEVTISGMNKEDVGQTIANIKTALHIKNKDCRVFQDGMYEVSN